MDSLGSPKETWSGSTMLERGINLCIETVVFMVAVNLWIIVIYLCERKRKE
jgi:hypothetical protein